ncbi:MAG: ADP-ribosylglycohydrolase family protein [Eubacteriales bacterium]
MKKLDYQTYLDKIYGCFIGKAVVGTMGAPYEGIKMPLDVKFTPELFQAMLPNDDLDLQVLWLDAARVKGPDFTSYDLLERFVNYCDYSPGEYAIMRKNWARGIYPPLSGKFCNDFYTEGMGCPIRSEIWACLAPADPTRAADFSSRDGVLDHYGESVNAERFFAALESAAFVEDDLGKLIQIGLSEVPQDSKLHELVSFVVFLCEKYSDNKVILRKILRRYGHPDCTNMWQNVAITLMALIKGELDLIKTGIDALNCGFDTDCTCATAGAVIGAIRGAKSLIEQYGLGEVRYVLGVRSDRRSDSVRDLAEDIALLGCSFNPGLIEGAPDTLPEWGKDRCPVMFEVSYPDDDPSIAPGDTKSITLIVNGRLDEEVSLSCRVKGLYKDETFTLSVPPLGKVRHTLTFSVPYDAEVLMETNIIKLDYIVTGQGSGTEYSGSFDFGLVGSTLWKAVGPIWETDPICTQEKLDKVPNYWHLFADVKHDGDPTDIVRRFHLNFAVDTQTSHLSEEELFAPLDTYNTDTKYEEALFVQPEDSFTMDDICSFKGPCVIYLSRQLVSPEDTELFVQLGHSSPVALYVNGALICERKGCDTWNAENVHVGGVKLNKGINNIVLRLTRVNADAKFNLTFAKGACCAEHYVSFGSVNPTKFK